MAEIPERFSWAAGIVQAAAHDKILEIGCGTGILGEIICKQLLSDHYTGIDRSAAMLEKAQKRNYSCIQSGHTTFIIADFIKADLPAASFDKIVAFNVPFFRKEAATELTLMHKLLRKGGKLFIFFQEPYEINLSAAEPLKEKLQSQGFHIEAVHLQPLKPTSALCIIAKPK